MHLVVLYEGSLLWDQGSKRVLQQLLVLARSLNVRLVPLHRTGQTPHDVSSDLAQAGVDVTASIALPAAARWAGILPGAWWAGHPDVSGLLRPLLADADWLMVGNSAVAGAGWLRGAAPSGTVLTWDGDALAAWHRSARGAVGAGLGRRLKERVRGTSMAWVERHRLSGFDILTVPGTMDVSSMHVPARTRRLVVPNVLTPLKGSALVACRSDLLFVGTAYGPNVAGMQWFFDEVWPGILAARPETTLHMVGSNLHAGLFSGAARSGAVTWHGPVDDLWPHLLGAGASLAPIFFGSGTPNKVVEACAANSPVVTTPHVAARLPELALVGADTARAWTQECLRIIEHGEDPATLATRAAVAMAQFGDGALARALDALVTEVVHLSGANATLKRRSS